MPAQLTPAAQRALAYAAHWRRTDTPTNPQSGTLGPVELLLGLLAEPECRAAVLSAARGVTIDAVRARWPATEPAPAEYHVRDELSPEAREAVGLAEQHLLDYPAPHELATEHLLLGLALGRSDVAQWLATKGWDAGQLAAEIDRLVEHDIGPLDFDLDTLVDGAAASKLASKPPVKAVTAPASREPTTNKPARESEDTVEVVAHEAIARLRIIDAAANRAGEAIRVIEDYARFGLDDRHLAALCKSLRHELATALSIFPAAQRHAARETRRDVGTTLSLASEQHRVDLREVVAANLKRLEQALRSLEEYAKPTSAQAATLLEQLRYRAYTLERAIDVTAGSLERLSNCRLYVLVDGRESVEAFSQWVEMLISAGVDAIQLRDKHLADRELLARARTIRRLTLGSPTLFIVNDRPDIARLAGADGVHVGQEELGVKEARTIVGPDALVGVSTHSLEQAQEAVLDGANYIGVGPTFPSPTKQFAQFPGLELLRAVSAEIRLPAFAIGGISIENIGQVRAAGFDRVAVSSAVSAHPVPAEAVRRLKGELA